MAEVGDAEIAAEFANLYLIEPAKTATLVRRKILDGKADQTLRGLTAQHNWKPPETANESWVV